jgi:hypothetical protein
LCFLQGTRVIGGILKRADSIESLCMQQSDSLGCRGRYE